MDYLKLARDLSLIKRKMIKIPNIQRFLKPYDGESFVLRYLYDSKNLVISKEICDSMNISSARVAKLLNQLEKKNMIKRKRSEKDARNISIELLPEGINQCIENEKHYNENAMAFLKALGEKDAVEYIRLQNKIVEIYTKDLITRKKDENESDFNK